MNWLFTTYNLRRASLFWICYICISDFFHSIRHLPISKKPLTLTEVREVISRLRELHPALVIWQSLERKIGSRGLRQQSGHA